MTFNDFMQHIKEDFGSINKYCEAKKDILDACGISRATFYHICDNSIKNPTRENLIAFSRVSGVSLEEVTDVLIIRHRNTRDGD